MATKIIAEPSIEPVTLEEQKLHSRIDTDADNVLILSLIKAARANIEGLIGVKMIQQEWKMTLPTFPADDFIELPYSPIISVDEIKTIDENDVEAVFASSKYVTDLISIPAIIKLKDDEEWDDPTDDYREVNGVEIKFKAGYGDAASNIPERLKLAIKMLVAHFYENREATTIGNLKDLPMGIQSLISQFRTWQRII